MPAAPTRLRRALPSLAVSAVVLAGSLVGCSGERPELAERSSTTTTTEAPTTTTTLPPPGPEVAQAKESSIDVYASEDAPTPDRQIVSGVDTSVDTIPIVFFVKSREREADRVEVYLPVRPNGSSGWVDASDVNVSNMPYKVKVGVGEHRLQVLKNDKVILDEPVGVGRSEVPTPGGIYYLKELLAPPNPNGAYGPYAYGLSGFSNVLQSFNGGTGVIGIHGTNEPELVGTDVSHGCIRLKNEAITKMVEEIGLPLGTPVEIDE